MKEFIDIQMNEKGGLSLILKGDCDIFLARNEVKGESGFFLLAWENDKPKAWRGKTIGKSKQELYDRQERLLSYGWKHNKKLLPADIKKSIWNMLIEEEDK